MSDAPAWAEPEAPYEPPPPPGDFPADPSPKPGGPQVLAACHPRLLSIAFNADRRMESK